MFFGDTPYAFLLYFIVLCCFLAKIAETEKI